MRMEKAGRIKTILFYTTIFLVVLFFCNLIYLPGPDQLLKTANMLFLIGQICGVYSIPIIGMLSFQILIAFIQKKRVVGPKIWILPFSLCFSLLFAQEKFRTFARDHVIEQAQNMIHDLEVYRSKNGFYPSELENQNLNVPDVDIIAVSNYQYEGACDHFTLSFSLPVLFFYNSEIVTYSSGGKFQAIGKLPQLYETKYPNWKYQLSD